MWMVSTFRAKSCSHSVRQINCRKFSKPPCATPTMPPTNGLRNRKPQPSLVVIGRQISEQNDLLESLAAEEKELAEERDSAGRRMGGNVGRHDGGSAGS